MNSSTSKCAFSLLIFVLVVSIHSSRSLVSVGAEMILWTSNARWKCNQCENPKINIFVYWKKQKPSSDKECTHYRFTKNDGGEQKRVKVKSGLCTTMTTTSESSWYFNNSNPSQKYSRFFLRLLKCLPSLKGNETREHINRCFIK